MRPGGRESSGKYRNRDGDGVEGREQKLRRRRSGGRVGGGQSGPLKASHDFRAVLIEEGYRGDAGRMRAISTGRHSTPRLPRRHRSDQGCRGSRSACQTRLAFAHSSTAVRQIRNRLGIKRIPPALSEFRLSQTSTRQRYHFPDPSSTARETQTPDLIARTPSSAPASMSTSI